MMNFENVVPAIKIRPVIYQLLIRTFGNTNETRKIGGTLADNGCGKFNDINDKALLSLKSMGFTHLWLTGILEQASGTAYPNRPADNPNIHKGIAGSPYAIKDYYDVSPDYAIDPEERLAEFRSLLERCRLHGFRTIIDFVPNHVSRSYDSDVKPELSFGHDDDRHVFFHRDNHFYYLSPNDSGDSPPLKLPTTEIAGCDGLFQPETNYGRVTGNNMISWSPSINDWYETVKLNYGHDFTKGRETYLPDVDACLTDVPKTWRSMDAILAYWQDMGVSGFRVDMAHMIPIEFWRWALTRAKSRQSDVFFLAEAYDNDPAKLTDENVLDMLISVGFDAVYDDPIYDLLEGIYYSGKWANDLDDLVIKRRDSHHFLCYAENHDEVRLANPSQWGGVGMKVGKPVTAVLFSIGCGPVMIYHGQEIGEPAIGAEGFGKDDSRTSIFDYWSMPEFTKWVNDGKYDGARLSDEQKSLRKWYGKLISVTRSSAFTLGEFYGLNHANKYNPNFGRVGDETVSGHWLYAYLRYDSLSNESFLVIVNFHNTETLRDIFVDIPAEAWKLLGRTSEKSYTFINRLDSDVSVKSDSGSLLIRQLEPCSAMLLEIADTLNNI